MTTEEQKVNDIEEALDKERVEYSSKISDVIKMINRIDQISEAQVLMLSYRHMMVDKIIKYRAAVYKKKANDQNYKKLRYEYYKTQHDVRLDYREIMQFVESDSALRTRQTEILENHINYFSQCIDTLDKLGFAVKNKIQVEEINQKMY
jgi:hypothetical protein